MDKIIAKELLFDTKEVFSNHGIEIGLMFGTLLGAIREQDFISHDANDVDVFITPKIFRDFDQWKQIVLDLERKNIRVQGVFNESYCGLVRGDHHVDCFIPKRLLTEYVITITGRRFHFPLKTFDELKWMSFLGRDFLCPRDPEGCLTTLYGSDWKTPKTTETMVYSNSNTLDNHNKIIYTHYMTRD